MVSLCCVVRRTREPLAAIEPASPSSPQTSPAAAEPECATQLAVEVVPEVEVVPTVVPEAEVVPTSLTANKWSAGLRKLKAANLMTPPREVDHH